MTKTKYKYEVSYIINSANCLYASAGKINIVLNKKINSDKDFDEIIDKIIKSSFQLKAAINRYKNYFKCKNVSVAVVGHRLLEEAVINDEYELGDLVKQSF